MALLAPLFESVPPKLYGGTERVVYNLCRGLTEADVEVTLFASADSSSEGRIVPVINEALRLRRPPAQDPVPYHLKMLSLVAQQASEFDVIHNHHDYWMYPLTQMTDTPVLTTLHGRLDFPDLSHAFTAYPGNQFIAISENQRRSFPGLNWVRTVHHGISTEDFEFHEKPGKYLAFLGRIDVEKRPDLAIEIAKRSGVPLKIAAKIEGPKMQEYYDAKVRPHVDGKFIEFIGEISESEKSDFLGNALALAFPIDWPEPFGLVVIEALACGTPVLARPCGAVPELLEDGTVGFVDLDVRRLAERVRDLPAISRRKCRQWVEERFSLRRMTEDYVHVYQQLRRDAAKVVRSHRSGWDFLHSFQRTADRDT